MSQRRSSWLVPRLIVCRTAIISTLAAVFVLSSSLVAQQPATSAPPANPMKTQRLPIARVRRTTCLPCRMSPPRRHQMRQPQRVRPSRPRRTHLFPVAHDSSGNAGDSSADGRPIQ